MLPTVSADLKTGGVGGAVYSVGLLRSYLKRLRQVFSAIARCFPDSIGKDRDAMERIVPSLGVGTRGFQYFGASTPLIDVQAAREKRGYGCPQGNPFYRFHKMVSRFKQRPNSRVRPGRTNPGSTFEWRVKGRTLCTYMAVG